MTHAEQIEQKYLAMLEKVATLHAYLTIAGGTDIDKIRQMVSEAMPESCKD